MVAAQTLLLVNADARIHQRLCDALVAQSWVVIQTAHGDEALELAKRHVPDVIALCVLGTGADMAPMARMLKLDPVTCAIPIVVLSNLELSEEDLESWAVGALTPTASPSTVVATLQHVLAKQKHHQPYVLVVDDEPDLVEILTAVLNQEGFSASGALNGREALEVIRNVVPDAILLDLDMPEVNGWELLTSLRASGLEDIRIVILTGKDQSSQDRRRGLLLGASEYLLKPCAPEDIVRALQDALRSPRRRGS